MERGWRIRAFEWDTANEEHVARHGITPQEIEEVFRDRVYIKHSRSGRYYVAGRSGTGRQLILIVEKAGSAIRVITARDMDRQERRLYRKRSK